MSEYPCQVQFEKHFERGSLHGLVFRETMGFMSIDDAIDWARAVTKSDGCDYYVPWILDLSTGKKKFITFLGL